jgi:hypothetical protein
LNLNNKSPVYQDWKSLGLLSSNDSQSSSGYTAELFGSNRTPEGIPIRDLLESRSSYSYMNKDNHFDNNNHFSHFTQSKQTSDSSNLFNYGKTYKTNGSSEALYNKQEKTLDLIAKYLKI